VKPVASKLQGVDQFPKSTTRRQVLLFLGLTGYYHCFIPHYATFAAPLTNLTKKSEPDKVNWTAESGKAFNKLKSDDAGLDHPIAYFSRKLLPRKQKFSTIEKECLAIKLGIEAFCVYLQY